MFDPWKPRGSPDPVKHTVAILLMAYEGHRDAVAMAALMTPIPVADTYDYDLNRLTMERIRRITLRGGYGLVMALPHNRYDPDFRYGRFVRCFQERVIARAREFHTEAGWPYAWRVSRLAGVDRYEETGRSPDNRGDNLRTVIKVSIRDLWDGSYREKGVEYSE